MLINAPCSQRVGFRHAGLWLVAQVSFATRMVPDFKIDGRVCGAFRPCRARAARHGGESEHSTSLTPAPYTADDKKLCGTWKQGWGMSEWSH